MYPIKNLTKESFGRYGYVLEYNPEDEKNFQIVCAETGATGWRLAVARQTRKAITGLGRHPDSMESFEPVSGVTVLCVSDKETPDEFEFFLLDKPVCLNKNIWHGNLALSASASYKVAENAEVSGERYSFPKPVSVFVCAGEII